MAGSDSRKKIYKAEILNKTFFSTPLKTNERSIFRHNQPSGIEATEDRRTVPDFLRNINYKTQI